MIYIKKQFANEGLEYDRLPSDTFSLPYQLDSIKLQPNELAVSSSFNKKIEKLYINFLYLYKLCFISSFLPRDFYKGRFAQNTGFVPKELDAAVANQLILTTQELSSSNKALSIESGVKNVFYTLFANTSAIGVITLNRIFEDIGDRIISSYTGNVNFVQKSIDPLEGSIFFNKIGGICQQNNKTLYVTESNYNNLYSYNIKDSLTDDNIKKNILFQQNIIGGKGSIQEKSKFNNPSFLTTIYNNLLLVADVDNKCFKIFDNNFSWVSTSTQSNFFKKYLKINGLAFHSPTNQLLVLTDFYLHIFDINDLKNITLQTTIEIIKDQTTEEVLKDIKFANYDSNIVYLLSSKRLLKKWFTKLDKNIAVVSDNSLNNIVLDWIVTTSIDEETDLLLVKAVTPTTSYFYIIEDTLNLKSLIKRDNFEIYSKEETFIRPGEYTSSWVYSKSIKKLLYNLNLLVDNIIYRFYTEENTDNTTKFIYTTYNSIVLDKQIKDVNKYANVYINENFQSETINRCFELLFNYQKYILSQLINNEPINVDLTPHRLQ